MMFFKIEQVLLAPQSRDFVIEAFDVPAGRNPGGAAQGTQLRILGVQLLQGSLCAAVKH